MRYYCAFFLNWLGRGGNLNGSPQKREGHTKRHLCTPQKFVWINHYALLLTVAKFSLLISLRQIALMAKPFYAHKRVVWLWERKSEKFRTLGTNVVHLWEG
jgi:hypothetical protein